MSQTKVELVNQVPEGASNAYRNNYLLTTGATNTSALYLSPALAPPENLAGFDYPKPSFFIGGTVRRAASLSSYGADYVPPLDFSALPAYTFYDIYLKNTAGALSLVPVSSGAGELIIDAIDSVSGWVATSGGMSVVSDGANPPCINLSGHASNVELYKNFGAPQDFSQTAYLRMLIKAVGVWGQTFQFFMRDNSGNSIWWDDVTTSIVASVYFDDTWYATIANKDTFTGISGAFDWSQVVHMGVRNLSASYDWRIDLLESFGSGYASTHPTPLDDHVLLGSVYWGEKVFGTGVTISGIHSLGNIRSRNGIFYAHGNVLTSLTPTRDWLVARLNVPVFERGVLVVTYEGSFFTDATVETDIHLFIPSYYIATSPAGSMNKVPSTIEKGNSWGTPIIISATGTSQRINFSHTVRYNNIERGLYTFVPTFRVGAGTVSQLESHLIVDQKQSLSV